ncbi:hypothetical protein IW261DRAFT_730529 [Armillaria novae-zelandiae]|uniref:Uncharacterized protein n=1 Tax=Armillaria novae-zelandiae TaxID=153914 RepID=A0AA39NWK6_9AGAR|nr:hypothetical protein IW261DRAFT_730529 [Armillaria novae-zelandiae]
MSGTRSKTNSTLIEARKAKLDRFYEDSPRIDDQTKMNNRSLLGIIHLFLDDTANEVTEDPKFAPFLQFIKRILVHLLSSSDQPLAGTTAIFATLAQDLATLTEAGRRAWRVSHPHSRPGDSMVPYIVSYIRHSPPAIVLVDTEDHEEPRRATKAYSWGFVRKGADENNEMLFSRRLVTAYIELAEKVKADNPLSDPACPSDQLVIIQSVIMVAFLHELTHTITKSLFNGLITSVMRGQRGEAGEDLEQILFGGLMCVEWLRRDFDNRDLRMKRIQKLYIMHVVPSQWQDQESNPSNPGQMPAGGTCFYELEIEGLRNDVADCNAGPADGSHTYACCAA